MRKICMKSNYFTVARTHVEANDSLRLISKWFSSYQSDEEYGKSSKVMADWLDVGVVRKKGKVFHAKSELISTNESRTFPSVKVYTLSGKETLFPDFADSSATDSNSQGVKPKVKLIFFSVSRYGFNLVRGWRKAINDYNISNRKLHMMEICWVEHSFLSWAKSVFLANLKSETDPSQYDKTGVTFGGVWEFAMSVRLPNKYTGYCMLLDAEKKIRWMACGEVTEEELKALFLCVETLDPTKSSAQASR